MIILGLILVFGAIAAYELPGLIKGKLWRELALFSALMLIGFIYSLGMVIDINILPNPTKPIEFIFKPSATAIVRMLKR